MNSLRKKNLLSKSYFLFVLLLVFSFLELTTLQAAGSVVNTRTQQTFTHLQTAIKAANSGDTLLLTGDFGGSFNINKSLTLQGKQFPVPANLSGEGVIGSGSVLNIQGSHKAKITVSLFNLNISNGAGNNLGESTGGGGIFVSQAILQLSGVTIQNNFATFGGAIYLNNSLLITTDSVSTDPICVIKNNMATSGGRGGGIYVDGESTMQAHKTQITSNTVQEGNGGGIYIERDGNVILHESCKISSNSAQDGKGGGIRNRGQLNIIDCQFDRNTATFGGALSNTSTATLFQSHITMNNAITSRSLKINSIRGGGIHNSDEGVLSLIECSVIFNQSIGLGGGLYNAGMARLGSSIVEGNIASTSTGETGGGIYTPSGKLSLVETKVINNTPDNIFPPQ